MEPIELFDSHTHLQLRDFDADRQRVIERAVEAGVKQMLCVGFNRRTSHAAIQLASETPGIAATVGLHPHEASAFTEALLDEFRTLAQEAQVVALGEMGLDFYRDLSPRQAQYQAFETQLQLAVELGLPVIIHQRAAHQETLDVLQRFRGRVRGVMHCFSGDWTFAERCLDLGFLISLAGPVTYRRSETLWEVARKVPLTHLLIETDCPWLTPQFRRGKRNEPAYVRAVAERIAELRGVSLQAIASATTANAQALLSRA